VERDGEEEAKAWGVRRGQRSEGGEEGGSVGEESKSTTSVCFFEVGCTAREVELGNASFSAISSGWWSRSEGTLGFGKSSSVSESITQISACGGRPRDFNEDEPDEEEEEEERVEMSLVRRRLRRVG